MIENILKVDIKKKKERRLTITTRVVDRPKFQNFKNLCSI